MNERHLKGLLLVDARKALPTVVRSLGTVAVMMALFVVFGRATRENVGLVLLGTSILYVFPIPMAILKDKLDGGMEFLSGLPLSGSTFATSRFVAGAASVLPGALQVALAVWWWLVPAMALAREGRAVGVAFMASWMGLSLLCWLLSGLITRYRVQDLTTGPAAGILAVGLLSGAVLDRVIDDPLALLKSFIESGWAPFVSAAMLLAVAAGLSFVSYHLLRRGFRDFVPGLDTLQW